MYKKKAMNRKDLQQLAGRINYIARACRPARLFMSRILAQLRGHPIVYTRVTAGPQTDIRCFLDFLPAFNGVSLVPASPPVLLIEADSCMEGAGPSLLYLYTERIKKAAHISQLEAINCLAAYNHLLQVASSRQREAYRHVLTFIEYLTIHMSSPASVRNVISSLSTSYKKMNWECGVFTCFHVLNSLKSLDHNVRYMPVSRPPIAPDHLDLIITYCLTRGESTVACALAFSFAGFLRQSNIAPKSAKAFDPTRHFTRGGGRFSPPWVSQSPGEMDKNNTEVPRQYACNSPRHTWPASVSGQQVQQHVSRPTHYNSNSALVYISIRGTNDTQHIFYKRYYKSYFKYFYFMY